MSNSISDNLTFVSILPAPYFLSLLCRWVFPSLVNKCLRKKRDREGKRKKGWCYIMCTSSEDDHVIFPYIQIISVFIRLAALVLLLHFSLRLTQTI